MATQRQKRASLVILGVWAVNAIGLIALAAVLTIYWANRPPAPIALAAQTGTPRLATPAPNNPPPTIYYLPTVTRNPRSTPITVPTSTPFVIKQQRPIVLGYSVSGRPLEVYRFGSGETVRLIVAGIHGGNEWNTIALADQLITYLADHPETVPSDKTLFILRDLNPDGEARVHGVDGRVNDHGVDLNHNWPYRWKAEWARDGCWDYRPTSAGAYAASEAETIALMLFINLQKPDALISYHSAALGIFPGGVPTLPASERLAEAVAEVSKYPYPPLDTGCDYSGNLTDWASSVKGIAAIDIELTNHRDTDFDQNLKILKAFLDWQP